MSGPHSFPNTPFAVSVTRPDGGCGFGKAVVTILMDGQEIGSYERNYLSYGETTFHPFRADGRWLALYSRDYTATRVMSLPDCVDLGGEERDGAGFCPVAYHVPSYRKATYRVRRPAKDPGSSPEIAVGSYLVWSDKPDGSFRRTEDDGRTHTPFGQEISERIWCPFGFVSGCIWGDDGSWKIQVLDLREASVGRIVRTDPWDYAELPLGLDLADAVDMRCWHENGGFVGLARVDWRNPLTGEQA
jgi:hypothetical protein